MVFWFWSVLVRQSEKASTRCRYALLCQIKIIPLPDSLLHDKAQQRRCSKEGSVSTTPTHCTRFRKFRENVDVSGPLEPSVPASDASTDSLKNRLIHVHTYFLNLVRCVILISPCCYPLEPSVPGEQQFTHVSVWVFHRAIG